MTLIPVTNVLEFQVREGHEKLERPKQRRKRRFGPNHEDR